MRNIAEEYFNADTVEKKIRIKTEFESLMGGIENKSRDILELDAEDKKNFYLGILLKINRQTFLIARFNLGQSFLILLLAIRLMARK